jgi:hypothetical protein
MDESLHIYIYVLAVMIRMVFRDRRAEAEILTILLWEARTRSEDIYPALKCFVATIVIPLNKMFCLLLMELQP